MKWFSRILSAVLVLLIRFYQGAISPFFPTACRYNPTCSTYALQAIRLHGPFKGFLLALKRISRCHPWGGSGYDPVPSHPDYISQADDHIHPSKPDKPSI